MDGVSDLWKMKGGSQQKYPSYPEPCFSCRAKKDAGPPIWSRRKRKKREIKKKKSKSANIPAPRKSCQAALERGSLFHSSLSDQQKTSSGQQPRLRFVSQHQILAGNTKLKPSNALELYGLPAPAGLGAFPVKPPQQLNQSKLRETKIKSEKTKYQVSRETEKTMIAVKIMFLRELVLHAQQRCHSVPKSCCFLRPASGASGDRVTGADKIFIDHGGHDPTLRPWCKKVT